MLQPRYAWRTLAHQADVRLLQVILRGLLLRKPLGLLRVPEDAPQK